MWNFVSGTTAFSLHAPVTAVVVQYCCPWLQVIGTDIGGSHFPRLLACFCFSCHGIITSHIIRSEATTQEMKQNNNFIMLQLHLIQVRDCNKFIHSGSRTISWPLIFHFHLKVLIRVLLLTDSNGELVCLPHGRPKFNNYSLSESWGFNSPKVCKNKGDGGQQCVGEVWQPILPWGTGSNDKLLYGLQQWSTSFS